MRVIILRGISGSGKSTYTKKHHPTALVCSADDYFMQTGTYVFDQAKLGDAHRWCMKKFVDAIREDHDDLPSSPMEVVVDNTNTQLWEFSGYVQVAEAHGCTVEIVRMDTPVSVAAGRNAHGVPLKSVQSMSDRFQKCLPWWKETVVSGTK